MTVEQVRDRLNSRKGVTNYNIAQNWWRGVEHCSWQIVVYYDGGNVSGGGDTLERAFMHVEVELRFALTEQVGDEAA